MNRNFLSVSQNYKTSEFSIKRRLRFINTDIDIFLFYNFIYIYVYD